MSIPAVTGVRRYFDPTPPRWRYPGLPDMTAVDATVPDWPDLPDLPQINFTDLYVTGDTFQGALNRLTVNRQVVLPDGFDMDLSGFPVASDSFGFYNNRVMGFIASARDQARIRLAPMSSTEAQRNRIPPQVGGSSSSNPLTMGRLGNGPSNQIRIVCANFTLEGTDQAAIANNENRPHNYTGLLNYYNIDSIWQNLLIIGIPGNWNSPPGETFALNSYKDLRSIYRGCEVTGINTAGNIVGGSPLGFNNSVDSLVEDCDFHDAYVSSLTWSFAGTHTNAAAISRGVTTRRVKIRNNANLQQAPGKRFTGFNHENVGGKVLHEYPSIQKRTMSEWNNDHMAFNNFLEDNKDITILEPEWFGAPPRNNGCWTVGIGASYVSQPNKQVTPPVVIKNGRPLTPHHIYSQPGEGALAAAGVTASTHYVVCH